MAAACAMGIATMATPLSSAADEPAQATPQTTSSSPAPTQAAGKTAPAVIALPTISVSALAGFRQQNQALDAARDQNLLPKFGATTYTLDQKAIDRLPQSDDTPIDKVLQQAPGVSQDSAISNPDFHIRNEYANVQYRINGIQLPDGVSALGPVLETNFIGNLNLLDGALPAQYGLRTAGVVDLTTKSAFTQGGVIELNGGSQGTVNPSVQYGGNNEQTQYFVSGSYLQSDEGLESATPSATPIHDYTTQQKFFGYGSTLLSDTSRLTYVAGGFVGQFQIPNVVGAAPLGDYGPLTLSSTDINENERDRFFFALVALQTHTETIDTQVSVYTRYATIDFMPDPYYDLAFNDVAAQVTRRSLLNGMQFDSAYRLNDAHTLRAGAVINVEQTQVGDLATVLPLNAEGNPLPTPVTVDDTNNKQGWTAGAYVQDEWRIDPALTLNTGLRFDQISQFVTANQFSPRAALIYTPTTTTTLHLGVSRYFTPPMQAQATPSNLALSNNTTQQQAISQDSPVRPERATYVDAGVDQQLSNLNLGADVYYKRSRDTLDDGQFGQAVVLSQFNYAQGFSRGVELKANYTDGRFHAYGNVNAEITKAKDVVSNQYLIGDPVELAYMAANYTYASDAQKYTSSFGASYDWRGILTSVDGIFGSGLRTGFANEQHTPGYTQWNASVSHPFDVWNNARKPLTVRLSAINLFDHSYILRSGAGIGEFAPQYGPRREIFLSLSQRI
jgi:outer membrane receptor protein involved in Fe transport